MKALILRERLFARLVIDPDTGWPLLAFLAALAAATVLLAGCG